MHRVRRMPHRYHSQCCFRHRCRHLCLRLHRGIRLHQRRSCLMKTNQGHQAYMSHRDPILRHCHHPNLQTSLGNHQNRNRSCLKKSNQGCRPCMSRRHQLVRRYRRPCLQSSCLGNRHRHGQSCTKRSSL